MAATDRWSLHLVDARDEGSALPLLRALFERLREVDGAAVIHPVADDAALRSERALSASVDRRIGQCLAKLREKAPFGELSWREVRVAPGGREAAVLLDARDGNTVTVSLAVKGAGVSGGYRLARPEASPKPSLVESVRSVMEALRT